MIIKPACLILVVYNCLCYAAGYCQSPPADTAFYRSLQSGMQQLYTSRVGAGSVLYSGDEYIATTSAKNGYRFFIYPSLVNGAIYYDGILYQDIPLAYDLVSNEIITKGYLGFAVTLKTDKIDYFSIADHFFIKINDNNPGNTFYEVVYNGKWQVLLYREKKIVEQNKQDEPSHIDERDDYFIKKDGKLYNVNSKSALMDLLGTDASKANDFYDSNRLDYKKDKQQAIIKIVSWYEQLNNQR